MKSKKFLWFLLRLNLIVWLAAAATVVWLNSAEAAPEKVTLCHFGVTKQVAPNSVEAHLSHGDSLGPCVAPEPTPTPVPASTAEPSEIVIENMWLIRGVLTDQPFNRDYMRWKTMNYCILISDTHPSYEQQVAKCFPPFGWYPLGALCAGPIYENDAWACDGDLQERGWSRLSLDKLCRRYPQWCDR